MIPYRSRTTTHGRNMAGARGLWRATGHAHAVGLCNCDWRWAVYRLAKPASSTRSMMTGSFSGRMTRTPCLLKIST